MVPFVTYISYSLPFLFFGNREEKWLRSSLSFSTSVFPARKKEEKLFSSKVPKFQLIGCLKSIIRAVLSQGCFMGRSNVIGMDLCSVYL